MVTNKNQHSPETRTKQAPNKAHSNLNEMEAFTPYDFSSKNLTSYGGRLPMATMLEALGFQKQVEAAVTSKERLALCGVDFCSSGFRLLLLGGSGGVRKIQMLIHHSSAQDFVAAR